MIGVAECERMATGLCDAGTAGSDAGVVGPDACVVGCESDARTAVLTLRAEAATKMKAPRYRTIKERSKRTATSGENRAAWQRRNLSVSLKTTL